MRMERHILVCDIPTGFTVVANTNGEAISAYHERIGRNYLPVTTEVEVDELIRCCNRPTVVESTRAARSLSHYERLVLLAEFHNRLDSRFDDNLLAALTILDMEDRRKCR